VVAITLCPRAARAIALSLPMPVPAPVIKMVFVTVSTLPVYCENSLPREVQWSIH